VKVGKAGAKPGGRAGEALGASLVAGADVVIGDEFRKKIVATLIEAGVEEPADELLLIRGRWFG
jgi:hypothetical protein